MHNTILLYRMGTNKNTYHTAWYEITRLGWDSNKLTYHIAWYEFMKLKWE